MLDLSLWRGVREACELVKARLATGDGQSVAKARNGNGHGSAALNRSLVRGATRRRSWGGLAASRRPTPPATPPAPPPTLAEVMAESDARYEAGKRLLRRRFEED